MDVSLHYLVKYKFSKFALFAVMAMTDHGHTKRIMAVVDNLVLSQELQKVYSLRH